MLKKLNQLLNAAAGIVPVAFVCYSIYVCWHNQTHPEIYMAYSAPWYTGIMVYGLFAAVVLAVLLILKSIVKKKMKNY